MGDWATEPWSVPSSCLDPRGRAEAGWGGPGLGQAGSGGPREASGGWGAATERPPGRKLERSGRDPRWPGWGGGRQRGPAQTLGEPRPRLLPALTRGLRALPLLAIRLSPGGLGPASLRDVPQGPVCRGRSGPAHPESDRAVGGSGAADWPPGGLAVQRPGCVGPTPTRCQPRNLSGGQIWGRDPHLLESVRPLPAACPGAKRSQGALGVRPLGTPSSSCTTEGLLPSDAVKLSMDHFYKQIASGENRRPPPRPRSPPVQYIQLPGWPVEEDSRI
ncbi:spidroin-2-like [Prionailurus bengalensis]|uniref:spidroin-2-like n=1 Tax=Prionailurus bengalensis TaxID=37029 RepID=UPI001CA7E825|nr:spidroin-2-like [Prionailurus bengalensis]